jgi:transcriptional regulator with XRE-family HTH domain
LESETPGSRIRAKRVELGIAVDQLAGLVGLSNRAIRGIEAGTIPINMIVDYLPKIAEELRTTQEALLNEELHSERSTRQELQRMQIEGIIRDDGELESMQELATQMIRKRSRADIPLNRQELLNLIEVIRGADGL